MLVSLSQILGSVMRIFCFRRQRIYDSHMMTSSNGNISRVTGPLWGESTGHKGQWRGALLFSLICAWTNGWANNPDAGDLRRLRTHCDVIVMNRCHFVSEHGAMKHTQLLDIYVCLGSVYITPKELKENRDICETSDVHGCAEIWKVMHVCLNP